MIMIGSIFPVLNARLHLSPDSSFVAKLSSERERTGLNKVAAEMLMYCDGTVTVDEIINQIISKYSLRKTSELYNGLVEFFIESKNLGHVVISPEEHKITPIISGSLKYFAPESIQIELTQQCPLKCEHCYVYAAPDKLVRMPFELVDNLLDQAKVLGVSNIVLTGGDPMMHPNFWEILEKASTKFYNVNLLTSGYLIDEKVAAKISKYRNINVQISVDGIEDTHNNFRGKTDAFLRTIKAFKNLQKYNTKVVWALTITGDNFEELEECIKLAKSVGVKVFRPGIVFNTGRAMSHDMNDATFIKKIKQKLSGLQTKYNDENFKVDGVEGSSVQSSDSESQKATQQTNCGAGWNFCHITAKGEVLACPVFPYELTNLNNDNLLDYFSTKDVKIRMLQSPKKEICKNCPHLERDNGCPAHGLISSQSNPDCAWKDTIDPDVRNRIQQDVYTTI